MEQLRNCSVIVVFKRVLSPRDTFMEHASNCSEYLSDTAPTTPDDFKNFPLTCGLTRKGFLMVMD